MFSLTLPIIFSQERKEKAIDQVREVEWSASLREDVHGLPRNFAPIGCPYHGDNVGGKYIRGKICVGRCPGPVDDSKGCNVFNRGGARARFSCFKHHAW